MKYIDKQNPPESFVQYSSKSEATFKDLSENHIDVKNELRESLLTEQGRICCYCGCRIETENTKIEHLKPRHQNPQLQLEYDNLLASCDGGQNARHNGRDYPSCCDDHKNNSEINVHPLMPDCESRFKFDKDGDIICAPDDLEAKEAIEILNLKSPALKNRRKAAIQGYKYFPANWDWKVEICNLERKTNGKYTEFCFVLKSYILEFAAPKEKILFKC